MEWPQIVTTITEGNAISTVVDAPWVSVTSVNGMTGDVITEPIMENFQTNHYYPKNTIVNHNGMLYWAKNTFTSTNVFDADDWYTLDITSSKVLTGQLQKTSYRRSVVALCEVSTTNNTSLNSYTSGRLAFHRYNGLSGSVEINVQAENAYGTAYYFNFDYYSNLNLLDGTADIETAVGFRPCTFKYNNVWYGGIEVFIGNAEFANVTFDGAGNFNIFGLDYYSVAHGTTEASILNQEVYDSLNYTQWTLSRSDFYADSFFANSGRLKKPGGYISTLPSKTGTLAQTSDIGNATLTIQRNGTTVNTFTANASSNVTANITVPTKTSDLTNNSGFITDAGVTSFNGSTGAVTYTAPVTSVNGSTGAVTVTNLERAELNVSPTSDIPSAWAAALPAGESWVWYNTASCFTNQPGRYGHLETIRNGGEVYQRWHGQSDGVTYYRAGNSTGWWGQSGGSGAFRKIIDNGQSATVTSNMIDWSTLFPNFCNISHGLDASTITSTTLTQKMHITLPVAGKYLILSCLDTYNQAGGFNGEVNTQLSCGSEVSETKTTFIAPVSWASTANIQTKIFTVTSSATVVLKASVNWPARGTCYINNNGGSFIVYVRIG